MINAVIENKMVKCPICKRKLKRITNTHLMNQHYLTSKEFVDRFPTINRGTFAWNKGETKETNASVARMAQQFKEQKKSNFSKWQKTRSRQLFYRIKKSEDSAELIGIILGDGCLSGFPRTERLRITCNAAHHAYIMHIISLVKKVIGRKPSLIKNSGENAVNVSIYRCHLSRNLALPIGNKIKNNVGIPSWIFTKVKYKIRCLKGLFETDGCFQEDRNNYAQYIEFTNKCKKLREDTHGIIRGLGYNPQLGKKYVRLARKKEVYNFKKLIKFRNY